MTLPAAATLFCVTCWIALGCEAHATPSPDAPTQPETTASAHTASSAAPQAAATQQANVGARGARTLRLATWNVAWLNRADGKGPVKRTTADYARLARYAARLSADVVALQEVDGPDAAKRLFDPAIYDFHFAVGGGAQRAGFAFRRSLRVSVNPDVVALDVGGVRAGADLSVQTDRGELRLLSVHLKSGCFEQPLTTKNNACGKLGRQLPELERWIDARAAESGWFAVLGDFNRRLFVRDDEPFWREIDDAEPALADLDSPTRSERSHCWSEHTRAGVDHLVFGPTLFARIVPGSFAERSFDAADAPWRAVLSDHCPLQVSVALD